MSSKQASLCSKRSKYDAISLVLYIFFQFKTYEKKERPVRYLTLDA